MRELHVSLRFSEDDVHPVGTLVEDAHRVWFQYEPSFGQSRFNISPLRLPNDRDGLIEHRIKPGVPIPGVFNDARPDGWGLKLLHRAFLNRGRALSSVSALDELAFLGSNTMGALTFEPATGPTSELGDAVELAGLAASAQQVWDDDVLTVLPDLLRTGGPSGGARPKALIGLQDSGELGVRHGEGDLPDGWSAWLVKFPTTRDDPDVGRREVAWMELAERAGLTVPERRLIPLDGIGDAFAVRRFDRPGAGTRRHMLSAAGALDVDYQRAMADYTSLLKACSVLCDGDQSQLLALFRLAVFNVATVNQDDHLKNIAWLMDETGRWRLSPAYDLTYAPRPDGERWTTVAGVGSCIRRADLLRLASDAGIATRHARRIVDDVVDAALGAHDVLRSCGCDHPVSHTAGDAVLAATERLR